MPVSHESQHHMKRVFTESFSVADIAEPLVSFDATTDSDQVKALMAERGYDVVGVRRQGRVVGFLRREELEGGCCDDHLREFGEALVLPETACFPTVVNALVDVPRVFVTTFGGVGGIVTRSDLQKPPVRMWLFGMVTIVEMGLMELIEQHLPGDVWRQHLSDGRLEKAEVLLSERKRRNQELDLLDCLQFADKWQIALRDPRIFEKVGFESRKRGTETGKQLESLRNNLAHAQDISADWEVIVKLVEHLDHILTF